MSKNIFCAFAVFLFCFTAIQAQTPTDFAWVKKVGGSQTEIGYDVATDNDSNVYVTGYYKGTAYFGSDSSVTNGGKDVFIAKYNASGNLLWHRQFGSTSDDIGYGIITDNDNNVYVTGTFSNNFSIGGSINLTNNGTFDAFVVKYNSSGNAVWGISFGSANPEVGEDITIDVNNNLIVAGTFQGTVDFGGQSLTSAGQSDIYIAKYDTSGTLINAVKSGGASGDECKSVATDASGNIFITGWFSSTATIAGMSLTATGGFDAYVAKFNSSGTGVWAYKASSGSGVTDHDYGYGIAVDKDGNAVITGYFSGSSIVFTSSSGSLTKSSNGNWEMFVAKYNNNGSIKWAKSYGGSNWDYAYDVKADYNKDIIVVGGIEAKVIFDGITITTSNGASSFYDDLFVLKLDSNGTAEWVMNAGSGAGGSSEYVWNEGVSLDNNGNVLFTGTFHGTVAFGTTNHTSSGKDETYGGDMFVGKISQNAVMPPDSVVIVSVTVTNITCNGANNGSISLNVSGATAPYSYKWSNGATIEDITGLASGTYTVTVFDANLYSAIASGAVTEPTLLTASISATHVSCKGDCTGSADLTASGGTTSYTFKWSNSSTSQDQNNKLCAGSYTVTVKDAKGCKANASVTITEPSTAALTASVVETDNLCSGDCDGAADLTASGGTAPYTLIWSNSSTVEDQTTLCAGSYTVTVKDANGCKANATAVVTAPSELLTAVTNLVNESITGACDGSINITTSGGTSPYTYSWSNGVSVEDQALLCAGAYTLTVEDINACKKTEKVTVSTDSIIGGVDISLVNQLRVYPTPSIGMLKVEWNGAKIESAEMYNLLGEKVKMFSLPSTINSNKSYVFKINDLQNGIYLLHITSGNKVHVHKVVLFR